MEVRYCYGAILLVLQVGFFLEEDEEEEEVLHSSRTVIQCHYDYDF